MRQIIRFPKDKKYKFGLTHGGGLPVKSGDFVSERDIKTYGISEQFLEPEGKEKEDWEDELPEGADRIGFNIGITIEGGDEFEKKRMIDQFEREFENYIRQKGTVILKVVDVQVIKKRKKKSVRKIEEK